MKIAWFTPFHVNSAIGEFSRHVTRALAQFAEVEIWTADDVPLLSTELQLVGYKPGSDDLKDLVGRDVIVYNMGNYFAYHGSILPVSREYPGVVILHDRALHHLLAEMWLEREKDPVRYVQQMGVFYGPEGERVALASLRGEREPVWESDEDVLKFPLYEESIGNALGVVTHSESQARQVRAGWLGPVAALHLPCYREVLEKADGMPGPDGEERVRLLTMGHINPNKQVHQVIKMLLDNPDVAAHIEYRVIGSDGGFQAYSEDLRNLITTGQGTINVEIVGWLADDELERELERAHVFVNFRHPNIESGSASLMKQLAYGRPILCFDSGLFGELPEGTVATVPVGDFGAAASVLRELVLSAARRKQLGERARALAQSYDESSYAEGLMELLEESRRAAPALLFLDSLARELGHMRVDARLPIFDDIASDFARILDV